MVSIDELAAWRLWMTQVFQPKNEHLAEVVSAHADLLEESEVPQCLLYLAAHVDSYKVILWQWRQGDFSVHAPPLTSSTDLQAYVKETYELLKARRKELLGG